jgi:hypothetical protein
MNTNKWNDPDMDWSTVSWPKLMIVKNHKKGDIRLALIEFRCPLQPESEDSGKFYGERFAWKYARIPTEEEVQQVLF